MKEQNNNQSEYVNHSVKNISLLQKPKKRCGLINEFLWSCAGVNKNVLRQCPSDYAKYAGIGGTILFTALMAALSGGYALNFVFDNTDIAIAFGIFWGLLIFNLDRFIVNTMYSDGKHTISWGEIRSGLPRIIMAIFLGIVISTPLELKIFEKEINVQMKNDIKEELQAYIESDKREMDSLMVVRDSVKVAPLDIYIVGGIGSIDNKIRQLLDEQNQAQKDFTDNNLRINQLRAQKQQLNALHTHQDSIKAYRINTQITNIIVENRKLSDRLSEISTQLETNSSDYKTIMDKAREQRASDIASYDLRIRKLNDKIENGAKSYKTELEQNFGGLRAKMKAFSELRKKNTTTDIAAWFIMLLFVIIETAPTFFKMMMEDGAYDNLLNAEKHRVKVLSQQKVSDVNDHVNTEVQISTMKNQKRLEAEILANEEVLKKLATVQAELLNKAIDAWREEELKKIAEDPKSYLQIKVKPENKKV